MGFKSDELLPGSLDLLVLRVLEAGPAHGYTIMDAIWTGSGELFRVEEGALYPALHRLQLRGWLAGEWGISEAKRRAKFYRLTVEGARQLQEQRRRWEQLERGMNRLLGSDPA